MEGSELVWAAVAVAFVASLYASVGHGGASGYLAIMAILSFPPEIMKPGALVLNLIVAGIAAVNYFKVGHFRFHLLWPFALTAIPFSYLGARMKISPTVYGLALAVTLIWAGGRLALVSAAGDSVVQSRSLPSRFLTLTIGSLIGFVSGVVGVGGGIFLSPILILMRWAELKEAAAVSAAFIWLNSAAGILGHIHLGVTWPPHLTVWILAAAVGGLVGSYAGARKFSGLVLRRVLAVVLFVAAAKSIMVAFK